MAVESLVVVTDPSYDGTSISCERQLPPGTAGNTPAGVPRPVVDTSKQLPWAWITTDAVGPLDPTVDLESARTLVVETRAGHPDFVRRMRAFSAQQDAQLAPSRRIIEEWRSEASLTCWISAILATLHWNSGPRCPSHGLASTRTIEGNHDRKHRKRFARGSRLGGHR